MRFLKIFLIFKHKLRITGQTTALDTKTRSVFRIKGRNEGSFAIDPKLNDRLVHSPLMLTSFI
jgi:hypothetical protein